MQVDIKILENNCCRIIIDEGCNKQIKNVDFSTLLSFLTAISQSEDITNIQYKYTLTDILPGDSLISTIQVKDIPSHNAKWYILLREAIPHDFVLNDKTYKNVALPKTLYAIKVSNDRCVSIRICAIKDRCVTNNSVIYKYPYSNVFDTNSVCLGNNHINNFDLKDLNNLVIVPEMFLSMPNNIHGYNGVNSSGLEYKDLLEKMQDSIFDESILNKSINTPSYELFIKSLN